jgi:2-amino-4-hydroxy-6-hydroxymethyldihydropteridine diphosphokinase
MAECTLLLGGNRGDLHATFARATTLIEDRVGPILASSRDHWTTPWGFDDDRLFLNRALLVDAHCSPHEAMPKLLAIEQELGRVRQPNVRFAARTIDIDILFVGPTVLDFPDLTVPHPRVHERAFALGPAADIVPALVHPLLHRTVLDLLNATLCKP